MLSTCPLNSRPPYASTLSVARWPGAHVLELRLLEVRRHPHVVERDDRHQRLARPGRPGRLRRVFRLTTPLHRRLDGRVLQVQLGLREHRARLLHVRLGGGRARPDRRDLLGRRLRRSAVCARACFSPARACTRRLSATANAGLGFGDLAPGGIDGGPLRVGGGDGGVELLLRHLVLGEQPLQPLDVARRLGRVGLRLAHPGLRGREARPRGLDALFGLVDARRAPVRPRLARW